MDIETEPSRLWQERLGELVDFMDRFGVGQVGRRWLNTIALPGRRRANLIDLGLSFKSRARY